MDQTGNKEVRKCRLCTNIGSLTCSACRLAFYCSAQHQKEDWKNHRKSCVSFKIVQDQDETGSTSSSFAVATRAMTPGSIILDEQPLFTLYQGPACYCVTCGYDMSLGASPFSLGTGVGGKRCTTCHWPVCGDECEKLPLHAENECKVFKENNIYFNPYFKNDPCDRTVKYVALARAISLKKNDPERWNKLLKVLCSPLPQQQPGQAVVNNNLASSFMAMDLPDNIVHGVEGEWIQMFDKLLWMHGHFLQMKEDIEREKDMTRVTRRGLYIFETASQFAHSCSSNCDWIMGTFPDFKIRVRASVPIKKGDRLHLDRLNNQECNPGIYGTEIRQQAFLKRYNIPCRCDLCLDPTEFGSFQSALVCPACKLDCIQRHRRRPAVVVASTIPQFGYLLPQDPTKVPTVPTSLSSLHGSSPSSSEGNDMEIDPKEEDDPLWECNGCGHVLKFSSVSPQLVKSEERLGLKWDKVAKALAGSSSIPKLLQCVQAFKTEQFLHPNHWLFQKAARHLHFQCIGVPDELDLNFLDIDSGVTWNVVEEREKMLLFQVQVLNKTMPGLHRYRVTLMRALTNQMTDRCGELTDHPLSQHQMRTLQKAEDDMKLCLPMQKEIMIYYKTLPLSRGHDENGPVWSVEHVKTCIEYTEWFLETIQEEIQRRRFGGAN